MIITSDTRINNSSITITEEEYQLLLRRQKKYFDLMRIVNDNPDKIYRIRKLLDEISQVVNRWRCSNSNNIDNPYIKTIVEAKIELANSIADMINSEQELLE